MKPMLAVDFDKVKKLRFPMYASPKLDGIRCLVTDEGLRTRSLKPVPNRYINEILRDLPVGLDGELIVGEPNAHDVYNKTISGVMSVDGEPSVMFYVFDNFIQQHPYHRRADWAFSHASRFLHTRPLLNTIVQSEQDMDATEEHFVNLGYEGIILRAMDAPYKFGRSTPNEQYLIKRKRFKDSEAVIVGCEELLRNANDATINELGFTDRSSHKANMVRMNTLGALLVRDIYSGLEFKIGTGFTAEERAKFWGNRITLFGEVVKYKYFPVGIKNLPRHPVFLGFRAKEDL